jgi:hypothetical protein
MICAARRQHPSWGPAKLVAWPRPRHLSIAWPAVSTAAISWPDAGWSRSGAAGGSGSIPAWSQPSPPSPTISGPSTSRATSARGTRSTATRSRSPISTRAISWRATGWRALRPHRHPRPLAAQRLVAAARHSTPADPAGPFGTATSCPDASTNATTSSEPSRELSPMLPAYSVTYLPGCSLPRARPDCHDRRSQHSQGHYCEPLKPVDAAEIAVTKGPESRPPAQTASAATQRDNDVAAYQPKGAAHEEPGDFDCFPCA